MCDPHLDVQEEALKMMACTWVTKTCRGSENTSPELLLRLRAPVDLRFNDLGHERQQGEVREMRKGAREVMETRKGREDAGTHRNVSSTAMFPVVLRGGVWTAWWLRGRMGAGEMTGRGRGLCRGRNLGVSSPLRGRLSGGTNGLQAP